jgi:hypothetical protein
MNILPHLGGQVNNLPLSRPLSGSGRQELLVLREAVIQINEHWASLGRILDWKTLLGIEDVAQW